MNESRRERGGVFEDGKEMVEETTLNPYPLLVPGRNCWRRELAERAAFLIDGEAYFQAFRDVALQAKQSIFIVGWDLDTQIELVRGEDQLSGFSRKLGEFLVALLRRKRKLRVYVLIWDFAMIYAWEREWMPTAEPGWSGHRRFSYEVDGQHPLDGGQSDRDRGASGSRVHVERTGGRRGPTHRCRGTRTRWGGNGLGG